MQYEGQTSKLLKRSFTEHYRCMKKPGKIDIFYRHFKLTDEYLRHISIQPVENILYDDTKI